VDKCPICRTPLSGVHTRNLALANIISHTYPSRAKEVEFNSPPPPVPPIDYASQLRQLAAESSVLQYRQREVRIKEIITSAKLTVDILIRNKEGYKGKYATWEHRHFCHGKEYVPLLKEALDKLVVESKNAIRYDIEYVQVKGKPTNRIKHVSFRLNL
jgi:hypothetical protein